jgi:hypothetical protein
MDATATQLDTEIIAFAVGEALDRTQPDDMPPGKQGCYVQEYYEMRNALRFVMDKLADAGIANPFDR